MAILYKEKNTFLYYMLIVLMVMTIAYNQLYASSGNDVEDFVNNTSKEVIAIIQNKDLTDAKKTEDLSILFKKVVDTNWIGKFSLGKYWRTATVGQQKEYLNLYTEYLAISYVPNFKSYTADSFKILSVTQSDKDEYLVKTEIKDDKNSVSIHVNYRLFRKNNEFVIFDVLAEGVSLITTQRSEFTTIIARYGLDYLIDQLSNKVKHK